MDQRFDRIYLLKSKEGEIKRLIQLCEDYHIAHNDVFEHAANFHIAWGFGPDGVIYISPTTFLNQKPDFNSIEELEDFLNTFEIKN